MAEFTNTLSMLSWRATVDGRTVAVDVPANASLAEALVLAAAGGGLGAGVSPVKIACGEGSCGACSVLVAGELTLACLTPAGRTVDLPVQTAAGLVAADSAGLVDRLVQTGALQCGFCTPGFVVALSALRHRGIVPTTPAELASYLDGNLCRCTGYQQLLGAALGWLRGGPIPSTASAQTPTLPPSDAPAKVAGAVAYGSELHVPGMLHGAAVRCPFGHARALRIDASAARQLPGVVAVVCAGEADIAPVPGEVFYDRSLSARPLLDAEACFAGAPVALIAALTREAAQAAVAAVQVDWQELPVAGELAAVIAGTAPPVKTGESHNALPFGTIRYEHGDPDGIFAAAAHVVDETFATATVQAAALEPYACVVAPRPGGGIVVHKGVPAPYELRRQMAQWLKIPEDHVEIRCPPTGGGFGSRMDDLEYLAALLALRCGAPVRLQLERGEGYVAGRARHGALLRVRSALDTAGNLLARELEVWYDCGAYLDLGPFVVLRALRPLVLYPAPHVRFVGHVLRTNKPVAGATRGFGNPQATFAVELHNASICRQLALDPLAFRRRHLTAAGAHNFSVGTVDTQTGVFSAKPARIGTCAIQACITWAAEAAVAAEQALPPVAAGWRRGSGLACAMHTSGKGRIEHSAARVTWRADGTLLVCSGAADQGGTGVATTLRLVAAQALDLDPALVAVELVSTAGELPDSGSHASGRTYVAGTAVWQACRALAERRAAGDALPLTAMGHCEPSTNAPPFCACQAIVDVELATGRIAARWLGLAVDAGTILNPVAAKGQVLGAAVQGLGFALSERLDFGAKGELTTRSLADYGVPRAAEVPPIEVFFVPGFEPSHPLGCKGLGEIGLMPVAPALADAVLRATGQLVARLPLAGENAWQALGG